MAQWYVKELSQLTGVSVQTLHHYDRIGLLVPSLRQDNGYRLYSESDLLQLQQIIALKYFGFKLSHIKELLAGDVNVVEHLTLQAKILAENAKNLLEASAKLQSVLSECGNDKSIPWETIINLIEVYRMTDQLEKSWAGKVLSPAEFKDYVKFTQSLETRFSPSEKQASETEWANIVDAINANLDKDPTSKTGIEIAKRCMDWVSQTYGKEHIHLRIAVWEKGFKGGPAAEEYGLSSTAVQWLDDAMDAQCIERVNRIFAMLETHSEDEVLAEWEAYQEEMLGDNQDLRESFKTKLLGHDKVCQAGKTWLKSL